jgi:hypothetical protein
MGTAGVTAMRYIVLGLELAFCLMGNRFHLVIRMHHGDGDTPQTF